MNRRTGICTVVRTAGACALSLAFLFVSGCMSPVILEFEDQYTNCRVENPDGNYFWDTDLSSEGRVEDSELSYQTLEHQHGVGARSTNLSSTSSPQSDNQRSLVPQDNVEGNRTYYISNQNIIGVGLGSGFRDYSGIDATLLVVQPRIDDLSVFSISFNGINIRNRFLTQGAHLVRTLRFSNHEDVKETDKTEHFLEINSGARYFRLRDTFSYAGTSDITGGFFSDTSANNVNVGPQLGLKWGSSNRKWSFEAEGIYQLGYNRIDGIQTGQFGDDLISGQLNRPLFYRSPKFSNQQDDEGFSPIGEFRATAWRQLTESLSVRAGYSLFYFGNLQYAQDAVVWRLPDMGISTSPDQDWFTETLFASIELRR